MFSTFFGGTYFKLKGNDSDYHTYVLAFDYSHYFNFNIVLNYLVSVLIANIPVLSERMIFFCFLKSHFQSCCFTLYGFMIQEKKSLYASPGEFQSLIKQVLSWDIRSLSQRNRPHDALPKKENDELLGNASDVDDHENETLVHEREQNAINSSEIIYHLILEGLDVSYRIDHDGNVIVDNVSPAVQDNKHSFFNYLTWKDKMQWFLLFYPITC